MTKKFQLSSVALLLCGIALSGCAPKQQWSPELAEARKAYQKASSDPLVSSLAATELTQAKTQLQEAENAADYFKSREEIAHEAKLSHLKSLEAEQTARALKTRQNVELAQAEFEKLTSEIALTVATTASSGSLSDDTMQQITSKLDALSQQIAQLQEKSNEPALAAARPALVNNSPTELQINEPVVIFNARLREELRAINARPSDNGIALVLGERYFESGTANLWNGRASRHLDNIAAVMAENTGLMIDVEAHTDNQGTSEAKDKLTSDRATAIKAALVIRGVDGRRINTTGYGDSAPIADNNTQLGRLQNRRVEIVFPNIEGV